MKLDVETLRFAECVEIVFRGWTAIQLAVHHEFGGRNSAEKAKWAVEAVAERFEKNKQMKDYEVLLSLLVCFDLPFSASIF